MPGKRKRDPSEYNPKERGAIGGYYRKQKKTPTRGGNRSDGAGPSGQQHTVRAEVHAPNIDSDSDIDYYEPDAGVGDGNEAGTGRAGQGGAGEMGNLGTQEMGDRPFGKPAERRTKTFTKSFTSYITNGVASMNWVQSAGSTTANPSVQWNEGWSMPTGWGIMDAAMTPHDWMSIQMISKRHRIKGCSIEIEGMIPFQEQLGTTGNLTVATASNRPNIWLYVDHDKVLPKLGSAMPTHNGDFQLPYGKYSNCNLPRPTFILNNLNLSAATLKTGALPLPAEPQRIFTLMNTGKVRTVYPGQKIHEHWTNPDKAWRFTRLPYDNANITVPTGTNATTYQQGKLNLMGGHASNGVAAFNQPNQQVYNTPMIASSTYNFYADTGNPLRHNGPPYIMMKVEPYYDSADNALNIYMQCHIHYTVEVEYEEIDKFNTIVPYDYTQVGAIATATRENFNTQSSKGCAEFGNGNEQDAVVGPYPYTNSFLS
uniref:Uncharacterized protein n=1 Tax=Tarsiger cyanurus parvoviridae sp. TaxID=2794540 RepID=A0A8A4XCM3_9VIRU|nr:MAG: hypothetical protein [Tarsiger cyanurus parvoviridae sp.]